MPELMTGVGLWGSRHMSPKVSTQQAQVLEQNPHVDQAVVWDQLMNWFPQALWTAENTPKQALLPDVDSIADPFTTIAFALAGVERLGFAVCCDALRREPAELAQTLLTLAMATAGKGSLFLGAGEARHVIPFGRRRQIGLKRLEDALQVLRKLLKETEPVDHDGRVWQMKDAFIGNGGKDTQPEVIAMGGGPRLTEAALRYADGVSSGMPFVFADADRYAAAVDGHRETLESLGRDPSEFSFGLHHILFLCENREEFEQYVDNPLVKWYAATGGRINQNDWDAEGIEPVMPRDWHYAFKMLPGSMSERELLDITDQVPPEMVRKTFLVGTPKEIAAQIEPFVQAGADRHLVADVSGLISETDPMLAFQRLGEVCEHIKTG